MKRHRKVELFIKTIHKFYKKEKMKILLVGEDKRLVNILAYATKNKKYNCWKISYNVKAITESPDWRVIHIALHELGHIVTDADTATKREYKAELYALTNIKKYYNRYFNKCCSMDLKYVVSGELKYGIAFKKALKTFKKI